MPNLTSMTAPCLHHVFVTTPGASPRGWLLFVHGVFGAGNNWRTIARRFVEARPEWGAVLVDLRHHGNSGPMPGPSTVESAAEDLMNLQAHVPGPVEGILGHSLGGKVALEYVRLRRGDLEVAWIVDSTPSPRPTARGSETVTTVLKTLKQLPTSVATRDEFVGFMASHGIDRTIGTWLALNLRPAPGGYQWGLDLNAIDALLADYWHRDSWPIVEVPPGRVHLHMILGGRSDVFDAMDRSRLERASLLHPNRLFTYGFPDAGHWVHADDPTGVIDLLVERTGAPGGNG